MKGLYIISCLAIYFQFGCSQEEVTLNLTDTSTKMLQKGAEVTWWCEINQGFNYLMSDSVRWYHEFSWNGTKVFLFSNMKREEADPAEWDDLSFDEIVKSDEADPAEWDGMFGYDDIGVNIVFKLTLLHAEAKHNGNIWCETGKLDKKLIQEANIVVYEELTGVELNFHGQTFTDDTGAEIQLELADPHKASCTAYGANPGATDIQIMFDGVAQTKMGEDIIEPMVSAATPMYSTKTTVEDIVTSEASEGKKVTCEARGPEPNGNMMKASATLTIIIRDPEITCVDTDAYPGKKHVYIDCKVNMTDAVGPFEMTMHISNIGQTLSIPSETVLKGDRIVIELTEVGLVNEIRINITEVEEWHLDTDFELSVKSKGDHITTHQIRLVRVDTPTAQSTQLFVEAQESTSSEGIHTNSGTSMAASLTVCAVAMVTMVTMLAALRMH